MYPEYLAGKVVGNHFRPGDDSECALAINANNRGE